MNWEGALALVDHVCYTGSLADCKGHSLLLKTSLCHYILHVINL